MNTFYVTAALWVVSFLCSVYSIVADSFTGLIAGVLFAFAAMAQEQFDNWR
jgi:type III secretory pathway component EscS